MTSPTPRRGSTPPARPPSTSSSSSTSPPLRAPVILLLVSTVESSANPRAVGSCTRSVVGTEVKNDLFVISNPGMTSHICAMLGARIPEFTRGKGGEGNFKNEIWMSQVEVDQ